MNDSRPFPGIKPDGIVLTIIIPVRNESRYIISTLNQLYLQSLDKSRYEVIVADGMSEDGTRELVSDFSESHEDLKITVLENRKCLSSAGRNLAIKHGSGDYFLLIDGHVYIDNPDLLDNYLTLAIEKKALCLGRPQPLDPPDISEFQKYVSIARQSLFAHSPDSHIYKAYEGWVSPLSIGVMYHKSLFDQFGYFDEGFDAAEDLEFNYRLEKAGIQCFSSSRLTVFYYPRENLCALFNQLTRYGYGRALMQRKHKLNSFTSAVPLLFFLFLMLLALLSTVGNIFLYIFLFVIFSYMSALLLESLRLNMVHERKNILLIAIIITIIHSGIAYGYLKGLFLKYKKKE